ncbi:autotransporter outer membrane beta-barrel domain-containing protein [Enterobacter chuandaensis]
MPGAHSQGASASNSGCIGSAGRVNGRSLQAQTGLRVHTRLEAGEVKIMPYTTAALRQGLVRNGSTRINETYELINDFTGTGGTFTGGISVKVTPSTDGLAGCELREE